MPRRTSKLAKQLNADLVDLGLDGDPRRIERLGEAGLLGEPPYGPDLVRRARDAIALVRKHRNRDLAALAMFIHGRYPIAKPKLDRAYLRLLERLASVIDREAGGGGDVDAAAPLAVKLASASAKRRVYAELPGRLKTMREDMPFQSIRSMLESFYIDALTILRRGRPTSDHGLKEMLEATGVAAATRDRLPGHEPIARSLPIEEIKQVLTGMSLGGIVRTVARASDRELEQARDDTLALVAFARSFSQLVSRVYGLPDAFGFTVIARSTEFGISFALPGMLILRSLRPHQFEELRQLIDRETVRLTAGSELLEWIPERFHPFLQSADSVDRLSDTDRCELKAKLDRFEREHPHRYALVVAEHSI